MWIKVQDGYVYACDKCACILNHPPEYFEGLCEHCYAEEEYLASQIFWG
jgi:hypothetical protein